MCRIIGSTISDDFPFFSKMLTNILHRGPDDKGFYEDSLIMLGNARLSIIDINGGHQPIFNEDEGICIVFNGEIYNYRELISNLKNHTFKTNYDTEVIIHQYE